MRYPIAVFMFISMAVIAGCGTGKMAGSGPDRSNVAPEVVGRVGGSAVLFEDLQAQYERNNLSVEKADTTRIREMREFLDLYLLYRAKLMEAKEKGLYESEEIVNELRQYELQYAIPYWVENEIQDQLIDEYIERINREIDATHILVAVPENATPADTLAAWNQLLEARNKALAGEDFERLSSEYSSMSEGRSMGGPLGYFTAGWAVKPFEDVAFSTPAGQISMPFRTQFGYHIILVKDIRERLKDRFVSHIYFNTRTTTPIGDSLAVVAQQVYNQLDNGADWAETVAQYSQDSRSIEYDGQIGWINYGAYDAVFTDYVFSVKPEDIGTILPPFQSIYGIHILRVDSVKTFPSVQAERDEALAALRNLPSFRDQRGLVLNRIRQEVVETQHQEVLTQFYGLRTGRDSTRIADTNIPENIKSLVIYELDGEKFTIGDYQDYIRTASPATIWSNTTEVLFSNFKDKMVEEKLLEITNERYPDYRNTIQNYLEGLAVFKLTEDEVWNYARTDTASLEKLFNANRSSYQFPIRYDIVRMASRNDSLLIYSQQLLRDGLPTDSLRNRIAGLSVVSETISDLSNEPFDKLQGLAAGDFTDIFEFRNSRNLLFLEGIRQPEQMTFQDAFFRLVSEYQPIREDEWNNFLKRKYSIQSFPQNIR